MKADMNLESLRASIPFLRDAGEMTLIDKGYSGDRKVAVTKNGEAYVLRVFDAKYTDSKKVEFDILSVMGEYDIKCSRPIEYGSLPVEEAGYMVVTYIDGVDASEALPVYPDEDQYRIGTEAGLELKKMHGYHAHEGMETWFDRKLRKHARYMEEYSRSPRKMESESRVLACIENNLPLMKGRPNVFQHDDFHPSNLIVKDGHLSGVIDFNRFDWGDPIHEFLKVGLFSSDVSIPFSVGQIRGYHGGGEPDERFWRLYSLYLAMSFISSVVWIQKVSPKETDHMMGIISKALEHHDGFERMVPKWYS